MILKKINIVSVKKKNFVSSKPYPSFFKEGFIFIKIFDEENNYGYGEPSPYIVNSRILINCIKFIFLKYFKNQNHRSIDFLKIKNKCKNIYHKKIISSFQQAILDLSCKRKNIPLYKFIGKKKINHINLYGSGGMIFDKNNYDILIEEAWKIKDEGYIGWKFRPKLPNNLLNHSHRIKYPPKFNLNEIVRFSKKLRKSLGDDFLLMLDCGCRCSSVTEAEYLIKSLNDLNFYLIEEPLKRNLNLYKQLKKRLTKINTFISAGEHIYESRELLKWVKNDEIDIFQPDSNLLLFEEIKIIKKFKKKIIAHNWCNLINNCANANFVRSLYKNTLMEHNILKNPFSDLFKNSCFKLQNGKMKFLNYKGLGIEFKKKDKNYLIYEEKI